MSISSTLFEIVAALVHSTRNHLIALPMTTPKPGFPPQPPRHDLEVYVARQHLGEPVARVVGALSSYGRLNIKEINQKTMLGLNATKLAVVVLCQLNCLYHWKVKKDFIYQLNPEGLQLLMHAGDIIDHIKKLHGEGAAQIIQNVLANGSVRIKDYCGTGEDENLEDQTHFFRLFSEKWLMRLQPKDSRPITELWDEIFHEVLQKIPRSLSVSEVKRVNEAKDKAKLKLMESLEEGLAPKDLYNTQNGVKRLKPDLVVKVNWSRYLKHLRTEAIVNLAALRVGAVSAKILELGLKHIEAGTPDPSVVHPFLQIPGLINDPEEERLFINLVENKLVEDRKIVFAVHDVVRLLPPYIDVSNSITTKAKRVAEEAAAQISTKRIKTEDGEAIPVNSSATEQYENKIDDTSISDMVQRHLDLLARGTLVSFLTEASPGNFLVPFTSLIKILKEQYMETIVKSTFGDHAFRVLRCLKQQRVGDEKSISNAVLLREKTVRNELYKLTQLNMVEIQEVPRSADRAASKTFFLFRHNPRHSFDFLKESLLYDMVKVLENIKDFKEDHKILLAKCEREDVKGHEEELLSSQEFKTLRMLQNREIENMTRFNRLKNLYNALNL